MSLPIRPVTELPRSIPIGTAFRTMATVRRVRLHVVFGLLLLAFASLIGRLVQVQLVEGSAWRRLVAEQSPWVKVSPVRGAILDRQGRPFAASRPVRHVVVEAGTRWSERRKAAEVVIDDVPRFASILSDLLDGSPSASEIRAKIEERRDRGSTSRSGSATTTVRAAVDDPRLVSRLDEARLDGLVVKVADRRTYPNGSWGGVVVGVARQTDPTVAETGIDGVEKELDAYLTGEAVRRRVARDGRGRYIAPKSIVPTEDGNGRTAWLTLDLVVQGYCEQALDAMCREWALTHAAALVLDPANGDVLGLASRPAFDPSTGRGEAPMNYATQGLAEVGSTFKPFTVARALERGVAGVDEVFQLPSDRTFVIAGRSTTIRDSHDGGSPHGPGTLVDVLAQSSNPDVSELAYRLGVDGMRSLVEDLGLPSRFGLVGYSRHEVGGGVDRAKQGIHDHLRHAFGHGVMQTPLRLAAGFCAFARDDFRPVTPRLVLALDGEALPDSPLLAPLVTSAAKKDVIRRGLRACVTEGTASKTVLSPRLEIAGKTGTALKPDKAGQYYSCSFAGYAPARAPRLVCLVIAFEPRAIDGRKPYGGAVAGPAVRAILERSLLEYMGVRADDEGTATTPAPASVPSAHEEDPVR